MTSADHIRFAIDTGGTFTDIVVLDEQSGACRVEKVLTTPDDVLRGMHAAISKAGLNPAELRRIFVYGSTTALNALLQRKGAPTAYLTTRGFRDVPEIGRANRPDLYNPKYRKPRQIVPRNLRFEVKERTGPDGAIVAPLDEEELVAVAAEIKRTGVQAVAVCFLHAYANPAHERRAGELLARELPGVSIVLSSVVAPEQREYERASTTILNAYLSPIVESALIRIEDSFAERGFKGSIILTKSDGGGMSAAVAKERAINTLLSGPAGGLIGGQFIAATTGHRNIVTADLGGTSFDVGVIRNGKAFVAQQLDARGFPVLMPNLDIRTIGAGGGSIARLDGAGALHVGPESASSVPGPICYALGGTQPTVTDAALVSGYIDPHYFLGGEMSLDLGAARSGIGTAIAKPAGLSVEGAARGILQIALSHMAGAVSDLLSESGDDPRDFTLLGYGGGGPLFAAAILDELQLPAAIVPVAPGNFSAFGMLMIDLRHDAVRAFQQGLKDLCAATLRRAFAELVDGTQAALDRDGIPVGDREVSMTVEARYVGQGHSVTVPVDHNFEDAALSASLMSGFHAAYFDAYGYVLDLPVEIVNLRVRAIGVIAKPQLDHLQDGTGAANAIKGQRLAYDLIGGEALAHCVYDRTKLLAGDIVEGPAIIEEATAVTPIRAGQRCEVTSQGHLLITRQN
jgi:N-methylhydantoinase A